jgi:hypothetical protein
LWDQIAFDENKNSTLVNSNDSTATSSYNPSLYSSHSLIRSLPSHSVSVSPLCVLMVEKNRIGYCDANKATSQKLWDGHVVLGFYIEGWGLKRQTLWRSSSDHGLFERFFFWFVRKNNIPSLFRSFFSLVPYPGLQFTIYSFPNDFAQPKLQR